MVALLAGVDIRVSDILPLVTTVLGPALDALEAHVQPQWPDPVEDPTA
ncbi:hypothetical protein ACIRL2_42505 [Embleya sp. NPDC127516]